MELRLFSVVCTAIYIYSNAAMAVSFTPLGDLPGGAFSSNARGVSADGSVVVGSSESASGYEAFLWTREGGMVGLGYLPGGEPYSPAWGVSADGSVVVGECRSASGYEAFRWTRESGMVGLGDLPGGDFYSTASGVSADGSVVVGASVSASGYEAFRWTREGGMVGLGDLPGGAFSSTAYDVSADGSVVVGASVVVGQDSAVEAFRWTRQDAMVGLGHLRGDYYLTDARGVSADGSVVVGESTSDSAGGAFRWTREDDMQSVASILTTAGVDLTGWTLHGAKAVSADGYTIVGRGGNPDGFGEGWIADLSGATTPVDITRPPLPDIKVNGSDGPLTLTASDTIQLSFRLNNNGRKEFADWWLAGDSPYGFLFWTPTTGWIYDQRPAYQGRLYYLREFSWPVFSVGGSGPRVGGLALGKYTLYFGVDLVMDGAITWRDIYVDAIEFDIGP